MKNSYLTFKLLAITVVWLFYAQAYGQRTTISYPDSWNQTGFHLEQQDEQGVKVVFSIEEFSINLDQVEGEQMHFVELPGTLLPNDEGAPNVPGNGRYIAVPQGSTPSVRILQSRTETFENINLAPAPNIPLGDDDNPVRFIRDTDIYSQNAFYPAEPVITSELTLMRGVDVMMLGITPFQYNPVSKELIVHRDIRVEITFSGGNGQFGDERYRNRWWDPIISDAILNHESLPEIDYSLRTINAALGEETGAEYLIIIPTNPEFAQWADTIRRFRQRQGISTKVVNINQVGGNTSTAIQTYVHNAYNTWSTPPAAVLIMADHGTDGSNSITSTLLNDHPGGGSYNPYISDMPYADVSGNEMPDITFARITARNAAELQLMVNKFLDHERNPPTNPGYYDNPITAMGWQTERWFQICAEVVFGFWEIVHDKSPVRINALYSGSPGSIWSSNSNTSMVVDYFGPAGLGYIPATPAHLTNWSGNATQVNNAINSGAFMMMHRDHGSETGWGEPDYGNSNINGTVNTDLTYVWSVNCLTGRFNWTNECFAEKFHRHDYGALGIMAATQVSYSFVNDTYVWGAMDNMWPEFMPDYGTNPDSRGVYPAFANDAGKYFLQQSNWPSNPQHKGITYMLFHHHGDAYMTVYSEMPQNLTVNHAPGVMSGIDFFEVTANNGSLIALTVDDEIIGIGEGSGAPVSIPIVPQNPGTEILITITNQNYYRYESVLNVIPPDQPYMIYQSHSIEDEELGNGNGQPDFGETFHLGLEVKNLGLEPDSNVVVTLTTASQYITIIDGTQDYGTIMPETTVFIEDAFTVEMSDEVPDNTLAQFTILIEGTEETWTSNFNITICAPKFTAGNFIISDHLGNNDGSLDPGETGYLFIETNNTGHSDASDIEANIVMNSDYITVNDDDYNITSLMANNTRYAVFSVTVSPDAPADASIPFTYSANLGVYATQRSFTLKLGAMIEDFESGELSGFNWQFAGDQDWIISDDEAWEGTYSAKSGPISHSQSTEMKLVHNVASPSSISFYRKVSSEAGYDKLMFYIDNNKMGEWSGNRDWAKQSYNVSAGERTFRWVYEKDASASSGSDCAWIDYIELPPQTAGVAFAGDNGVICGDETFTPNGFANNYSSILWTTSGTGSFSNPGIEHPEYIASEQDINNGSVMLTITVMASNIMSDDLLLTFMPATIADAGSDFVVCEDFPSIVLHGASAENYHEIEWTSSGTGYFDDPNSVNPTYFPSAADISEGSVTLMIYASNNYGCADASDQMTLSIMSLAQANAGSDIQICAGETAQLNGNASNFYTIAWSSTGTGTFNDTTIQSPVYTPSADDIASGSVTIILTAKGMAFCPDASSSLELSFFESPTAVISGSESICFGEQAGITITLTGTAPWEVITSADSNPVIINESPYLHMVSPGETTSYTLISVTDANTCTNTGTGEATVTVRFEPVAPDMPTGPDEVDYAYETTSVFVTEEVEEADNYTWYIEPSDAGSITADGTQASVSWADNFQGDVSISVAATNDCGMSEVSEIKQVNLKNTIGVAGIGKQISLNIFPNPTDSKITVEFTTLEAIAFDISVVNTHGKVVYYQADLYANDRFSKTIELGYLNSGMYFVQMITESGEVISRMIMIR
jgi:hypothetical protein